MWLGWVQGAVAVMGAVLSRTAILVFFVTLALFLQMVEVTASGPF